LAVIVTVFAEATAFVKNVAVAVVAPAGTETADGVGAADLFEVVIVTDRAVGPAGPLRVTVSETGVELPPTTVEGLIENELSEAA
jgi:hypothetical protein